LQTPVTAGVCLSGFMPETVLSYVQGSYAGDLGVAASALMRSVGYRAKLESQPRPSFSNSGQSFGRGGSRGLWSSLRGLRDYWRCRSFGGRQNANAVPSRRVLSPRGLV